MWGKYQVLVTTVPDGENRNVLVSLALVPVENKVNYEWVMQGHNAIPEMAEFANQVGLVVTTDRLESQTRHINVSLKITSILGTRDCSAP